MKPMKTNKVDARTNKHATFNEVMNKPLNNPKWIDTTQANNDFEKVQEEMLDKGEYNIKDVPNLNVAPARLVYFGLPKYK